MCHDLEEIQLCQLEDAENIFSVMEYLKDCFFNSDVDRKALAEKISNKGYFIAALIHDEAAGFVGFYANDRDLKTAFLSTIVVDKTYQRFGIGSLLVQKCLEISAEKGMQKCRLEVDKRNLKAIRFYERLGFVRIAEASEQSDFYEYRWQEGERSKSTCLSST